MATAGEPEPPMQKKALLKWIQLTLKDEKIKLHNLDFDLADGIVLAKLVTRLTGKKIAVKEPAKTIPQRFTNLTLLFEALAELEFDTAPYSMEKLASGRHGDVSLALVRALADRFQIKSQDELLAFVNSYLSKFNKSRSSFDTFVWSDGAALCALLFAILTPSTSPSLLPSDDLEDALQMAHTELGVPLFFNVSDVIAGRVDSYTLALWLSFLPQKVKSKETKTALLSARAEGGLTSRAAAAGGDVSARSADREGGDEWARMCERLIAAKQIVSAITDSSAAASAAPAKGASPSVAFSLLESLEVELNRFSDAVNRAFEEKENAEMNLQTQVQENVALRARNEDLSRKPAAAAGGWRGADKAAVATSTSGDPEAELRALRARSSDIDQRLREADASAAEIARLRAQVRTLELRAPVAAAAAAVPASARAKGSTAPAAVSQSENGTIITLRRRIEQLEEANAALSSQRVTQAGSSSSASVELLQNQLHEAIAEKESAKAALVSEKRRADLAESIANAGGERDAPLSSPQALAAVETLKGQLETVVKELRNARVDLERERKGELSRRYDYLERELHKETKRRLTAERQIAELTSSLATSVKETKEKSESENYENLKRIMRLEEAKLKADAKTARLRDQLERLCADSNEDREQAARAKFARDAERLRVENEQIRAQLLDYARELRDLKELKANGPNTTLSERFPNERALMARLAKLEKYRTVYKRAMAYRYQVEKDLDAKKQEISILEKGGDEDAARRAREDPEHRLHHRFEADYARFKASTSLPLQAPTGAQFSSAPPGSLPITSPYYPGGAPLPIQDPSVERRAYKLHLHL